MTNRGKQLEQLVRKIESHLLPDSFSVSSNETLFDEEGVTEAEFDIIIEGKVGSVSNKWLIECRNRPSKGAAPRSWIEQLVGRKHDFDFDKVIAVSTTGYSPAAKRIAARHNITLRTVQHLGEIANDFETIDFRLVNVTAIKSLGEADMMLKLKREDRSRVPTGDLKPSIKLKYPNESEFLSVTDFIKRDFLNPVSHKNPDFEGTKDFTWHHPGPLDVLVNGQSYTATAVKFPAIITVKYHYVTTLSVKSYREDNGEAIGDEVSLQFDTGAEIVRCRALVTKHDGNVMVTSDGALKIEPKL